MTDRHSFSSTDHLNRDLNESPKTVDSVLNAAIVHPDIAETFEKYIEIFEAFYADNIEVSSDTQKEPIRGRAKARSLLYLASDESSCVTGIELFVDGGRAQV
jgi:hypothetical protein